MNAVVTTKVDDFRVDEAAGGRDSCAWNISADFWLHPGECFRIQIEDIIQLSELVGLSSKDIDFLVKSYCRVLKSAVRSLAMSGYWSAPLKTNQVKNEQLIEPVLSISTAKNKHLIVDNASSVELTHGCLSSDDAGNVEAKFVDSLLQVDEDDIREHLKSVPPSIDDNLTSIPDLTRMTHSGLR